MIHLAPLLGRPVGVVCSRRMLIPGRSLALGLEELGVASACPVHGFVCRHCLVDAVPIGSRGYATGVEFVAHLSRADGSSQQFVTIRWRFRRSGWNLLLLLLFLLARPSLPTFLLCCPSFLLSLLLAAPAVSAASSDGCGWLWSARVAGLAVVSAGKATVAEYKALRRAIDRIPWLFVRRAS